MGSGYIMFSEKGRIKITCISSKEHHLPQHIRENKRTYSPKEDGITLFFPFSRLSSDFLQC
jgi:hypothetical protein